MQVLLKLVARLPLRVLQTLGAGIGELTFWCSPGYRRRTRENLRHAGYDDPALFSKVGRNAGRQAMETSASASKRPKRPKRSSAAPCAGIVPSFS